MGLTGVEPSLTGGVLAIDAGNSKTDVAIVTADGRVLGSARGGGFHPPNIGVDKAVAGLAPLVAMAAHEAGRIRTAEVRGSDYLGAARCRRSASWCCPR